jgi:hypothetical protein
MDTSSKALWLLSGRSDLAKWLLSGYRCEGLPGIPEALPREAKVEVDARARVVGLRHTARRDFRPKMGRVSGTLSVGTPLCSYGLPTVGS